GVSPPHSKVGLETASDEVVLVPEVAQQRGPSRVGRLAQRTDSREPEAGHASERGHPLSQGGGIVPVHGRELGSFRCERVGSIQSLPSERILIQRPLMITPAK